MFNSAFNTRALDSRLLPSDAAPFLPSHWRHRRPEFQSHKQHVSALLSDIKDSVYDAEDLLDEFDYYALKLKVDCSKNSGTNHFCDTFLEFLDHVGSNDYMREVDRIQAKLDHIHLQSKDMGLHKAPLKFDELVRSETDSNLNETLYGREKELKQLLKKLGVRERKRGMTEGKARLTDLPVFSIVGVGGDGKTTTAQQICNDQGDVSSYNLDILMRELQGRVKSKKNLLVLDDMWDDILKDYKVKWKILCAPLKHGAQGSRILVTTRFLEVAELVDPDNHYGDSLFDTLLKFR